MAFTNSPTNSTYKTIDVEFDSMPFYRAGAMVPRRDPTIINMYYDRVSQENKQRLVRLKKRPGLVNSDYSLFRDSISSPVRGSFFDPDQNAMYWAIDNKVLCWSPDTSGVVTIVTSSLVTSSGYVGFCSYLKSDNTRYICFTDGTDLWIHDYVAATCNKVTDVDLPTPHEPSPIYIDGYLLLIKKNTSDIYNSDLDNPFSWTSDNFISAEINSDWGKKLYKVKNYVAALGTNSIEFFYNDAIETGSPFSRNSSPVKTVGYITAGCQIGDEVFFIGQEDKNNIGVYVINNFKVEKVSNSIVERTIQSYSNASNAKSDVVLNVDGYCISVDGHTFYAFETTETTWVYDLNNKFWYEWRRVGNTPMRLEATWNSKNGQTYVAVQGQSVISIITPLAYRDFNSNFNCIYITEEITAETTRWKLCNKISLKCSMFNNTGQSNAYISWSDNDWSDTGVTPRAINVFSSSPFITRCGRFRNRSFKIEYSDNYPFFITGLQLDLNVMGN